MSGKPIPTVVCERIKYASTMTATPGQHGGSVELSAPFSIEELTTLSHEFFSAGFMNVCLDKLWDTVGRLNGGRTATLHPIFFPLVEKMAAAFSAVVPQYLAALQEYEKQVQPHREFFEKYMLQIPTTDSLCNRVDIKVHVTAAMIFFAITIDGSDSDNYLAFKPVPVFGRMDYF